jgi:aldose 1-epimerase
MPIYQKPFGITQSGTPASLFILENSRGTRAVLTDFGVTLLSLTFAGTDVVLGYDDLKTYETQTEYLGATVGRFAGPIPYALLQVGEKTYPLTQNMEQHQIHGGFQGFSFRVWRSEILPDAVRFTPWK